MSNENNKTKWLSNDFKTFVKKNKNNKKQLIIIIPTQNGDLALSLFENYILAAFKGFDEKETA